MKLKSLNLTNYRAFKHLELSFDKRLTVIAGVNGIGKSSILHALRLMTAQYHRERDHRDGDGSPFTISDLTHGSFNLIADIRYKGKIMEGSAQALRVLPTPGVVLKAQKEIEQLTTQLPDTTRGSTEQKRIIDAIRFQKRLLYGENEFRTQFGSITNPDGETEDETNPLMIYFGTSRFLSRFGPKLKMVKAFSLADAFSGALDDSEVSIDLFAKWFRAVELGKIGGKRKGKKILKSLNDLIVRMMPEFHGLAFYAESKPYFNIWKGSETFELEELSDGERAILSLCFDITRRLAIANPDSDSPTEEGVAIILIDEVELHLHPKWQRQILRNLITAFPRCQFVVTTHSPQIIGQTRPECLRPLFYDENENVSVGKVGQAKGMDSSWILENIMGCPSRDYETEQKLASIYDMIDNENLPAARAIVTELEAALGNFPDLQEASSLLDRLEMLAEG